jgi:hypothetical protein
MSVKYYGASHPMVVKQTGDPARGEWAPKSKAKPKGGKRR